MSYLHTDVLLFFGRFLHLKERPESMSSYNHILTKAGNGLDSYSLEQRSFLGKKKKESWSVLTSI